MRPALHGAARLAVGLYRVSTAEQGQSGLGLEAQQASVRAFVAAQRWTGRRVLGHRQRQGRPPGQPFNKRPAGDPATLP